MRNYEGLQYVHAVMNKAGSSTLNTGACKLAITVCQSRAIIANIIRGIQRAATMHILIVTSDNNNKLFPCQLMDK